MKQTATTDPPNLPPASINLGKGWTLKLGGTLYQMRNSTFIPSTVSYGTDDAPAIQAAIDVAEPRATLEQTLDQLEAAAQDLANACQSLQAARTEPVA